MTRAHRRPSSFSIGRVAGIDIRVHFTFLLLVVLFAFGSSGPGGLGVVGGLAWLVVIFGCVVVHELAHCLVARRRGATVREIVLLPIGGVSRLEHLPEDPGGELTIAIAGPIASIALAGAGALAAAASGLALLPVDLSGGPLLTRLVWFNLIIGAFNLLPAFPLDGGRVFRALLARHDDLDRATRRAARVGRVLGVVLVGVGIAYDVWLVLIGAFVFFGASAEEAATLVHVRARAVRLGDVMLLEPIVVEPSTTVEHLRALMRDHAQRVFPVVSSEGFLGMVDAADVERTPPGPVAADLVVAVPTVASSSSFADAMEDVARSPLNAVAVADGARIVGLLRAEDVELAVAPPRGSRR